MAFLGFLAEYEFALRHSSIELDSGASGVNGLELRPLKLLSLRPMLNW